jgi:hypothetical protein
VLSEQLIKLVEAAKSDPHILPQLPTNGFDEQKLHKRGKLQGVFRARDKRRQQTLIVLREIQSSPCPDVLPCHAVPFPDIGDQEEPDRFLPISASVIAKSGWKWGSESDPCSCNFRDEQNQKPHTISSKGCQSAKRKQPDFRINIA